MVNPPLCRMLGYQADELLRLTFQQITHPDDLQADLTFLAALTARQRERYINHADGPGQGPAQEGTA